MIKPDIFSLPPTIYTSRWSVSMLFTLQHTHYIHNIYQPNFQSHICHFLHDCQTFFFLRCLNPDVSYLIPLTTPALGIVNRHPIIDHFVQLTRDKAVLGLVVCWARSLNYPRDLPWFVTWCERYCNYPLCGVIVLIITARV